MNDFPTLNFVDAPPRPRTFNVLLYGPPGSGKSSAAATAPGPLLWVNLEGPGGLAFARKVAGEAGTEIHEVRPDRDDILRDTLVEVVHHVKSDREPRVQTVVIDTVGKVRDHVIRNIGRDHPQIQHWGETAKIIEGFVQALRDLPVNLVLIAHESVKDSDDGDRIVEPLIGGATTAKVEGEVDIVAYTGRVEDEHGVRFMGQLVQRKGRRGKDRSGALGETRELDLTEWLMVFATSLSPVMDEREAALFGEDDTAEETS